MIWTRLFSLRRKHRRYSRTLLIFLEGGAAASPRPSRMLLDGNGPDVCLLSISLQRSVSPRCHLSLKCVTLLF